MSSGGPGRREVARRAFATEFDDATLSYAESDEERAPNYVVTPTGARVNRLFVVGVLTEIETVSEDYLRARVVDPTGPFVVYAGQYQPEALAFLEEAEPPQFVAVTGKARTYEPDDSDRVFTSIRPEQINAVDADTRDRWTVSAAEQTLARVGEIAAAAQTDLAGDRLRDVLVDNDVEDSLADGIPRALAHYGTTGDYLADLRETALDAARVVAGDRDEARPVGRSPDGGDDGPLADLAARTLDTSAATPGASDEGTSDAAAGDAALDDEPATETTAADSGAAVGTASAGSTPDATGGDATADGSEDGADQNEEPPAVAATTGGSGDRSDAGDATQDAGDGTDAAATATDAAGSADDATTVDADTTDSPDEPSMGGQAESSASPTDSASDAIGESASEGADESTAADADTDESNADLEAPDLGADDVGAGADGDATADDAALDDPLDEDEDLDDFEPEFELDEDEREELEDEFGTEFQSGTEVDEPGSTDLDAPDPETPDAGAPDVEEPTVDDASGVDDGTSEAASDPTELADEPTESATEPADVGDDGAGDAGQAADGTDESTDDAADEPADEAAADVDLDDAVVDAMTELDEGDGADREAVRAAVVDRTGADPGAVDDAIQDALMDGRCYEPDDATLKPI